MCVCSVAKLCLTLCDPMDCSPPGSSVHGIFHARILEWVAISSSRGSCLPMDRAHVSCTGKQILYHWATWEAQWLLRPGLRCDTTCCLWIPWVKANHQPSQIQGVGKLIQPLDGMTCKVKLQRDVSRGKWTIHTISPKLTITFQYVFLSWQRFAFLMKVWKC